MQTVHLSFDPAPTAAAAGTPQLGQETGPWGLFRLFGRGTLKRDTATPGRYTLSLRLNDRAADYEVKVGSTPTQNPFDLALLQEFRCPAVQ